MNLPLCNDLPSPFSCLWPHIHNETRASHFLLIMPNNYDCISGVPQGLECADKLLIIPGVETYARLIKDVYNAHELRSNLSRKPYSLCLPARERRGRALKCKVSE